MVSSYFCKRMKKKRGLLKRHLNTTLFAVLLLLAYFYVRYTGRHSGNRCLKDVTGNFAKRNAETECLRRICTKEPFTWIRWGDGENIFMSNTNNSRLRASFFVASHHSSIYLNVASWWLCDTDQRRMWNSFAHKTGRYYDYVYLNMGDPLSSKGKGLEETPIGWRQQVEKCNRKLLAVIPGHLDKLPIFQNGHTKIVRSPSNTALDYGMKAITRVLNKSQEPYVVIIADGGLAKMIAAELTLTHPNHTYIDIGSSLDGYSGVHSRDYNDPKKYCEQVKSREERETWFAPGVCA